MWSNFLSIFLVGLLHIANWSDSSGLVCDLVCDFTMETHGQKGQTNRLKLRTTYKHFSFSFFLCRNFLFPTFFYIEEECYAHFLSNTFLYLLYYSMWRVWVSHFRNGFYIKWWDSHEFHPIKEQILERKWF